MRNPFYATKMNLVYARTLQDIPDVAVPKGFEFEVLDAGRVRELFGSLTDRARMRSYLRFVEKGHIGVAMTTGDRWASVGWVAIPESAPPPHLQIAECGGLFWMFGQHTSEAFRRRGLHKALVANRLSLIQALAGGKDVCIFTDTSAENTASRRTQMRSGFTPAGVVATRTVRIPRLAAWTWGAWDPTALHPPLIEREEQ